MSDNRIINYTHTNASSSRLREERDAAGVTQRNHEHVREVSKP